MGPENNGGRFVAYMDSDGNLVEIGQPMPEIMPGCPVGGTSAEDAAEAMENMAAAMASVSITVEVAAEGMRAFAYSMELAMAVQLARIVQPGMVHRYLHTKKKRTRKKYEKRIMAWFREVR